MGTVTLLVIIAILILRIWAYKMELRALKRYIEKAGVFLEEKEIAACVKEIITESH